MEMMSSCVRCPVLSMLLFLLLTLLAGAQRAPTTRTDPVEVSSFAVDCGGGRYISGLDPDNANLGAASYYVTKAQTWGVSNVGRFMDSSNSYYTIIYSSRPFQNTQDSELFQTARISPSSLRYYGLGLENGNYTVTLQFADFDFEDSLSWKSLGRRVFDIYLQGERTEQNFDIRKAAGRKSYTVVKKQYIVPVTRNFLEIHLFWAGKGTCCVPNQGYYGPAISALSANLTAPKKGSEIVVIVGAVVGVAVLGLVFAGLYVWRHKRRKISSEQQELHCIVGRSNVFSYSYGELSNAVENFSSTNLLGEGGYGSVYKGSPRLNLDWSTRYEIYLGIARGLAYLHEESSICVVHRDIKTSNVLLDSNLKPKISDFGLAKLFDDKKTHVSTKVAGTLGYLAPEYAMRGHMTKKVDVFAFGVVMLEIIAGRPNYDDKLVEDMAYLIEWVWKLYEEDHPLDVVDPKLTEFNRDEVLRAIRVGLLCIQSSPRQRPSMSRVVSMLAGDSEVGEAVSKPSYVTEWQMNSRGQSSSERRVEATMSAPLFLSSIIDEGR
ncbi:unnamed protein product [Miscanthus lutarioriparius]|uniref:non-specific serine/threonine protein kinase n=1 Tax=Miscanthus lutarioriparius TaxID=422564 RepID=A0A811R078_9POAL|nr:unnamed protein product [Miscanthus lutarioriparius]